MAFPITSRVLIIGLIILVLLILFAFWLLYSIAKNSSIPGITSISGYNETGHNVSGYNSSGYNQSGFNASGRNGTVPIVKK